MDKKTHSISIDKYFEFKKPNYIYLKLTPAKAIRNYNSDKLLDMISGLYRSFRQHIKRVNKKLFFECDAKVSYYIYMEKERVFFYFIVPEAHYNLFKEKIIDIWNNRITIERVYEIPLFNNDYTAYYLTYKKEDTMSIAADKRNNALLGSLLTTIHIMEDNDRVGIFYNFNATDQRGWRASCDNTLKRLRDDLPIYKKRMGASHVWGLTVSWIIKILDILLDSVNFGGVNPKDTNEIILSPATKQKRYKPVIDTQIICLAESKDKFREIALAQTTCEAFRCLDDDNYLTYKKLHNKKVDFLECRLTGADTIKIQPHEGQNFLSLPGREIIEEYKAIDYTSTLESQVPKKLQTGYITLGICDYKDTHTEAFLRDNYDQGNFPLVTIGEQGSGKTTYLGNYAKCIQRRSEGALVLDFIKNCELSSTIEKSTPKDKLIVLDMSDISNAQGIGYNELKPKSNKAINVVEIANRKAIYIQMLIDALNVNGDPLSSSMDRYLTAASNIVFLDSNASLKDVVKCLNNHEFRKKCIDSIPRNINNILDDEISALKELDEYGKDNVTVIGTRNAKIDGINHRINILKKDLRLKMMFNKNCAENIDLVKAMDDGKIVLIKMPQEYFATPYSKNVMVTYWLTKVWCSILARGAKEQQPKRFHVIVDEIFQAKTAMMMLKEQEILPQTRKFGCKYVFSCQYLGQISVIDQTLRSAGASYMLMKGSGKANFNEFKDELAPYTLEDMEALPQYSSLNLINYDDDCRAKFITRLPKKV